MGETTLEEGVPEPTFSPTKQCSKMPSVDDGDPWAKNGGQKAIATAQPKAVDIQLRAWGKGGFHSALDLSAT